MASQSNHPLSWRVVSQSRLKHKTNAFSCQALRIKCRWIFVDSFPIVWLPFGQCHLFSTPCPLKMPGHSDCKHTEAIVFCTTASQGERYRHSFSTPSISLPSQSFHVYWEDGKFSNNTNESSCTLSKIEAEVVCFVEV
jgi:hypothetical protein